MQLPKSIYRIFKNVGYFAPLVFGKVVVPVDIAEKKYVVDGCMQLTAPKRPETTTLEITHT